MPEVSGQPIIALNICKQRSVNKVFTVGNTTASTMIYLFLSLGGEAGMVKGRYEGWGK